MRNNHKGYAFFTGIRTSLRSPFRTVFTVLVVCLGVGTVGALAQVLYGSLIGNVTDSSGSAVAGAAVDAIDTATNVDRHATTDRAGLYQFTDLPPGTYKVTVTEPTFNTVVSENIVVTPNTQRRINARLDPATVGQVVTVATAAPLLQTERAEVAFELQASQLEDLPASPGAGMRNFQSVYEIIPGFSPPSSSHSESGNPGNTLVVNVNGQSNSNNNTRIDGVSDIYPYLPEIAAYAPSTEAIQSVNVVTNSFDAEQGLAGGASISVTTKSGTNAFHGGAWEYNTISALAARNYTIPRNKPNPKYILNQFGANIGGPIARNRAYFFTNWERTRRAESVSGFQTVATQPIRAGNFQGTGTTIYDPLTGNADGTGRQPFPDNIIPENRISYAAMQFIPILPQPNINTSTLFDNYFASASSEYTRDNSDSRVDYNVSSKSTLFARYGIQRTALFDPQALGKAGGNTLDSGLPGNAPSLIQSLGLGGTYAFTSRVLLDANVGYLRQALSGINTTDINENSGLNFLKIPGTNGPSHLQGGFPSFRISGLSSLGNANQYNPFTFKDNTYTTGANLTWNRGQHSMRYGIEYQHYNLNHVQPDNTYGPRGGFSFTGGLTALKGGKSPNGYNSWADFLLGLPQSLGKDIQFFNPETLRESVWAFYARDQWHVTGNLTVNYGLRYERYPFAKRDHSGATVYDPVTGNLLIGGRGGVPKNAGVNTGNGNFAPRFGVAYRINDKTVVRSGYGISVNPDNYRRMLDSYPAVISQSMQGLTSYQAAGSTVTGIPQVALPDISQGTIKVPTSLTTSTYAANYRRGYIESYNLAVQRSLGPGTTLQATYVGQLSIREVVALNLNAAAPGTGVKGGALYQRFGTTATILQFTPMGTASYNALQVVFLRQFSGGGTVGANYTYSKTMDNYGNNSDVGPPLSSYLPAYSRNYGVADFDRTHVFNGYGNYMLPFGDGTRFLSSGIAGKIAGGWQLNAILRRSSGTPFTVFRQAPLSMLPETRKQPISSCAG